MEQGGAQQVTSKRKWALIGHRLGVDKRLTSASFTLKTVYMEYLLDYELEYVQNGSQHLFHSQAQKSPVCRSMNELFGDDLEWPCSQLSLQDSSEWSLQDGSDSPFDL